MKKWLIVCMGLLMILCMPANTWAEPAASPTPAGVLDGILHWPKPDSEIAGGGLFTEPESIETGRGLTVICVQQRLRELGYFAYKPTGYFGRTTYNALVAFQKRNNLAADGIINPATKEALFSPTAVRSKITTPAGYSPAPNTRPRSYGTLVEWEEVQTLIGRGQQFLVVDFASGLSFRAQRTGGSRHMEIECTDAEQYAQYLAIFGGMESYEKRAVLVEFGGKMIAASLCGYPHGTDVLRDNEMEGQLCLFFQGSTAHGLQLTDAEHQANILSTLQPE